MNLGMQLSVQDKAVTDFLRGKAMWVAPYGAGIFMSVLLL